MAYSAEVGNDYFVFYGDQVSRALAIVDNITWAPNSALVSYIAGFDSDYYVFVDSDKVGPYNAVSDELHWSSDSGTVAYVTKDFSNNYYLHYGSNIEGPFTSYIKDISWSPNTHHIAYMSGRSLYQDNTLISKYVDNYQWTQEGELSYTYSADNEEFFIIANDEKFGPYNNIPHSSMSRGQITNYKWSDDKKVVAAISEELSTSDHFVYYRNRTLGPYKDASDLTLSNDGNAISFISSIEDKYLPILIWQDRVLTGVTYQNKIIYLKENQLIMKTIKISE